MDIDQTDAARTYCATRSLTPLAEIARTRTSHVHKVTRPDGSLAVLKCMTEEGQRDEAQGASFLRWCAGVGAVRLIDETACVHLVEYCDGPQLVAEFERLGDDAATDIIVDVVRRLHAPRSHDRPSGLIGMNDRFGALYRRAREDTRNGGRALFMEAATLAERLLAQCRPTIPLHGDIHHENILSGRRAGAPAWLAIDPKGIAGEACYDVANVFCNPVGRPDITGDPARAERLADRLASGLGFDRRRMLQYAFVHACLSSCWTLLEGGRPTERLNVARILRRMIRD